MPYVTTDDGVRLHYLEHGDPKGDVVVLVAGFTSPATSWSAQQATLAEAGYRVLSLDRRGHGGSDEPPGGGDSMKRHGDDLAAFLIELAIPDAVLIGASMGGDAIWAYLDAHDEDNIRGVVIVDQTPRMLNDDDWPYGFYGYDESNRDTYFADSFPDPGRVSLLSKGPVRIARLVKAFGRGDTKRLSDTEKALLNDYAKSDWRAVIGRSRMPVLFVAGRESEYWPSEHAAAAAALAKKGRSVVIDKAGHAANIEQPALFDEQLLQFLGELRD